MHEWAIVSSHTKKVLWRPNTYLDKIRNTTEAWRTLWLNKNNFWLEQTKLWQTPGIFVRNGGFETLEENEGSTFWSWKDGSPKKKNNNNTSTGHFQIVSDVWSNISPALWVRASRSNSADTSSFKNKPDSSIVFIQLSSCGSPLMAGPRLRLHYTPLPYFLKSFLATCWASSTSL